MNRFLLVLRHAFSMYRALRHPKNSKKGGWGHISSQDLLRLAHRELEELEAALWALEHHGGDWREVVKESADLSNFTAMIADNARPR